LRSECFDVGRDRLHPWRSFRRRWRRNPSTRRRWRGRHTSASCINSGLCRNGVGIQCGLLGLVSYRLRGDCALFQKGIARGLVFLDPFGNCFQYRNILQHFRSRRFCPCPNGRDRLADILSRILSSG
jgi:hypothetical protein